MSNVTDIPGAYPPASLTQHQQDDWTQHFRPPQLTAVGQTVQAASGTFPSISIPIRPVLSTQASPTKEEINAILRQMSA
jgi:hypothetical protein